MIVADFKQKYGAFVFYLMGILAISGAVYAGFEMGYFLSIRQQQEIQTLNQTVQNINDENNKITKRLNILKVEIEVQQIANQQAQTAIQEGLLRESELREQLSFYQKVMAPELKQDGFLIDAFDIEKTLSEDFYRFDLVLMQQAKIKNVVKGNIDITLIGSENGKPKELRLLDLMPANTKPVTFSFKYFQVVKGQFTLPAQFEPEKILVRSEVYQFRKKRGELEKSFEWHVEHPLETTDLSE